MNKVARWSALALVASSLVACGTSPSPEARPAPVREAPAAAPSVLAVATTSAPSTTSAQPALAAKTTAAPAKAAPRKAAVDLKVKRLVLAEGVKGREPVEPGTSFKADDDRIYAFVEIENGGAEAAQVTVEFEPPGGGAASGNVTLDVGSSPHWRTWAYTRAAKKPGEWTAVVRSESGEVLAKAPFEVTL
jgi:hypothetical protein